jgi:antitoxin (DNA-binding transcriptional repressor) of toxin-antitoxin stability system
MTATFTEHSAHAEPCAQCTALVADYRHQLDEAAATIVTLQADVSMALDALREVAAGATYTVTAIHGEPVV